MTSLQTPSSLAIFPTSPARAQPTEGDAENNDDAGRYIAPGDPGSHSWNTPGGRTEHGWEWLPGTDLTRARVGVAEPHRFFRVRRDVANHQHVDYRIFPSVAIHDWNDADHVASLNKFWDQIESRTKGLAKAEALWTEAEKQAVIELVRDALAAGTNSETLKWEEMAKSLSDKFKETTQAKGSPLAQRTRMVDGAVKGHYLKPRLLKEDSVGAAERKWAQIKHATSDWVEVLQMLHDNQPLGTKEKRNDARWERLRDKTKERKEKAAANAAKKRSANTEEGEDQGELPTKKQKTKRKAGLPFKVPEDLPLKDHDNGPPPPPGTGGADFTGALPTPISGN